MSTTLLEQAIALSRAGKQPEARELLVQVITADVHNETAWLWYASTLRTRDDIAEALEECLQHNPDCQEARRRLAVLKRNASRPKVKASKPSDMSEGTGSAIDQAKRAVEQGNAARARSILQEAIIQQSTNTAAWIMLAEMIDKPDRRARCFEKMLAANPGNVDALQALAEFGRAGAPQSPRKVSTSQKKPTLSRPENVVREEPETPRQGSVGVGSRKPRLFDLNVEEMLENWGVEHALREVIANALDEQALSDTREIAISQTEPECWHIRDFGRGLRIEHFTLNENHEKLDALSGVIGKFGVGLKDALATFHRREIDVHIRSSHGEYRLRTAEKHSFDEIVTLHVEYDESPTSVRGTEFILRGVTSRDMARAKSLFLKFAGEQAIETTSYGQILQRSGNAGRVYIMGVFASEEPNFLFSYNITRLTKGMKKRLNRKRLNVGRTTYAGRVQSILKNSKNKTVHELLVEQVRERATGEQCDEMGWIGVSQMALNLMHQTTDVVYFTEDEIQDHPDILDNARSDGYEPIIVTEQQRDKLDEQMDSGGPEVRTVDKYVEEFSASFIYEFVDARNLRRSERRVYDRTPEILALVGIHGRRVPEVRISETMRVTLDNTGGVWDAAIPAIVIRRDCLSSLVGYAGILLHELGHTTGERDATRGFEQVLSGYLGQTAAKAIKR